MAALLQGFDQAGSVVCARGYGTEELRALPFPLAALICSVSNYAGDSDLRLLNADTADANMVYHRGATGLLWVLISGDATATKQQHEAQLVLVDCIVLALLGSAACSRLQQSDLKKQLRGFIPFLDAVMQTSGSGSSSSSSSASRGSRFSTPPCWWSEMLPLHWSFSRACVGQPEAAAAAMADAARSILCQVASAAESAAGAAQDTCSCMAVLQGGLYWGMLPAWAALPPSQQLVLQLLLSADVAEAYGEIPVHVDTGSGDGAGHQLQAARLVWAEVGGGVHVACLYAVQAGQLTGAQLHAHALEHADLLQRAVQAECGHRTSGSSSRRDPFSSSPGVASFACDGERVCIAPEVQANQRQYMWSRAVAPSMLSGGSGAPGSRVCIGDTLMTSKSSGGSFGVNVATKFSL